MFLKNNVICNRTLFYRAGYWFPDVGKTKTSDMPWFPKTDANWTPISRTFVFVWRYLAFAVGNFFFEWNMISEVMIISVINVVYAWIRQCVLMTHCWISFLIPYLLPKFNFLKLNNGIKNALECNLTSHLLVSNPITKVLLKFTVAFLYFNHFFVIKLKCNTKLRKI